jgi:16S rRNA (guanine527-N7)-methyltransferase
MRTTQISRTDLFKLLHDGLNELGQSYSREVESNLIRFIELMHQQNRIFNLTSIRDLDTMISRHLLDSLSIAPYIKSKNILDVGSGAGLPGIPLAIAMPEYRFILLDNHPKKIKFLQQIVYQLRLRNVQIVHNSIEFYLPDADKLFDTIVCRSFGIFPDFLNQIRPVLAPNAQVLAMKGVYPQTELEQIKSPFKLVKAHPLTVPYLNAERHVVEVAFEGDSI